jgi:RNA recognition motif-containing protein
VPELRAETSRCMYDQTPEANPKKLFVGSIPYSATEDQLRDLFSPHGELVEVKLITDRMTGRSKGIAFVTFAEESQAQAAIEAVNGTEMDGRTLIVNVARPPQPRSDRGGYGGDRRGGGGYNNDRQGGYDRRPQR